MASRSKLSALALAAALATLVALSAGVAGAAAASCDLRGGRTLLANTTVRFYAKGPARKRQYYVCTYANSRTKRVAKTQANREIKLVGTYDRWMFWIVQVAADQRLKDTTTRYAGITVWDLKAGRRLAQNGSKGYYWTAAAIGPAGIVAGIGYGEGTQVEDLATGQGRPPVSAVLIYDHAGRPLSPGGTVSVPRVISTAPLGTISDLGLSGSTIVWQQPDGLHTAPLEEHPEYPGTFTERSG